MSDDLIRSIERLRLHPDELLLVTVKSLLTERERGRMQKNLRDISIRMGWGSDRIVVIDSDIEVSVVSADQLALAQSEANV